MSYDKLAYEKRKAIISEQRRSKKQYKENKSILCRLCNSSIGVKGMSLHLKRIHGIEFKQYVIQHIADFSGYGWKLCPVCNTEYTKKLTCSRACDGVVKAEKFAGNNSVWYGKTHTEETKSKISKGRVGKGGRKGDANSSVRPEVREKISNSHKKRASLPGYVNPMTGKTHSQEALKKIFAKKKNTKPEQKIAEILQQHQIEFRQQWFLSENGNTYSYDFYLPTINTLLEVDGDYWHGGPGVKVHWAGVEDTMYNDRTKDMVAINQGYKIVRIWESQIKALSDEQVLEQLNHTRI